MSYLSPQLLLIDELLEAVTADIRQAVSLRELLRRLKLAPQLQTRADKAMQQVMLDQLVLVLARLFDPPRFDRDGHSGRASILHILRLLDDRDTLGRAVARAAEWGGDEDNPELSRMAQLYAAKSLQKARVRGKRLWRGDIPVSGTIDAIRSNRDCRLAHHLVDIKPTPLTIGDVDAVLDFALSQVELLAEGLSGEKGISQDIL